jgi:hypothetical protein
MRKIMCFLGFHDYKWDTKKMCYYCLNCGKERKCG